MPFPELHDILGTLGVLGIIVAYVALQAETLKFDDYTFHQYIPRTLLQMKV